MNVHEQVGVVCAMLQREIHHRIFSPAVGFQIAGDRFRVTALSWRSNLAHPCNQPAANDAAYTTP